MAREQKGRQRCPTSRLHVSEVRHAITPPSSSSTAAATTETMAAAALEPLSPAGPGVGARETEGPGEGASEGSGLGWAEGRAEGGAVGGMTITPQASRTRGSWSWTTITWPTTALAPLTLKPGTSSETSATPSASDW